MAIRMLNLNKKLNTPNLLTYVENNNSLVPHIFYFAYTMFIQTNLLLGCIYLELLKMLKTLFIF